MNIKLTFTPYIPIAKARGFTANRGNSAAHSNMCCVVLQNIAKKGVTIHEKHRTGIEKRIS